MTTEYDFGIARLAHRAFGSLIRLQIAEGHVLRLTPAEASSLMFALIAVRNGMSPEREIYMSPIASDGDFTGSVQQEGISINGYLWPWEQVDALTQALGTALDEPVNCLAGKLKGAG